MLNHISFEHFRAFKRGSIDLRPITILMGANGSGKTSILHLFLMLAQTALGKGQHGSSAFRINGSLCSVGSTENIFHRKKPAPISIGFGFDSETLRVALDALKELMLENFTAETERLLFYAQRVGIKDKEFNDFAKDADKLLFRSHQRPKDDKYLENLKDFYLRLRGRLNRLDTKLSEESLLPPDRHWVIQRRLVPTTRRILQQQEISTRDANSCLELYRLLKKFEDCSPLVTITLELDEKAKRFFVCRIAVSDGKSDIIGLDIGADGVKIKSEHFSNDIVSHYSHFVYDNLSLNVGLFYLLADRKESKNLFSTFVAQFLDSFLLTAAQQFAVGKLVHIGPLRAHPRRYYSPAVTEVDGEANLIIEGLRFDQRLRANVDKWFSAFGMSIELRDVEDFLSKIVMLHSKHSISAPQSEVAASALVPEFYDLIDSGFGYSQILPVVVRTLMAPDDAIILIEQPEIHLHPGMQSDLGDFFIDAVSDSEGNATGKRIVIETHSEYLLKRLQRRISTGRIQADMISLNFVEGNSADLHSTIRRETIEASGGFDWPEEFFGKDVDDMFALFGAN